MKKLLIIAICLLPGAIMAQRKFTIEGKVGSLNAPAKVYLLYRSGSAQIMDSTAITGGKFTFSGALSDIAQASMRIKHSDAPVKAGDVPDGFIFYLEPKTIQLISATDSVKYATIKGSAVNDDNEKYKSLTKAIRAKMGSLMAEYSSKTPEERKDKTYMQTVIDRDKANQKDLAEIDKQFYAANRDSYIGLITFYRTVIAANVNPAIAEPDFNKFSAQVKATPLGKSVAQIFNAAKNLQVGQLAMDFTQNDVNDKPVKLSDFKGKYVLLDFWASWCAPCRAENPNVVTAYNHFKDKNFTVLGISLDQPGKKDAWLEAIKKDGLTWTHLSDLKYWDNAVAKQYGIRSIPANYLIDPTGKIIAKNIRGEQLQKKLAEILGTDKSK